MKIKLLLGVFVLLLALVIAAVFLAGAHLGDLAMDALERLGPSYTQTTLTVKKVDLSLFAGTAAVKGLALGNPQGYEAPQSISISNVAISLVPRSILSDKIVLRSIVLRQPEITFEGNPFGENNLARIVANVDASSVPAGQAPATAPASPGKPAKKYEVDLLIITGGKVHAHIGGVVNQQVTLPLPDIQLTSLGQGADGLTSAELTKKVLSALTASATEAVVNYAANLGKGAAQVARETLNDVLQNPTSGVVGEAAGKLKKGIVNLLKK